MTEDALEYIRSQEEGVLQSDLWKALNIDSRKCSRIVAKLLKERLIIREAETINGIRTYRLHHTERLPPSGHRFEHLMVEDIFEPCAGCIEECIPQHCAKLSEWIFAIVLSQGPPEEGESLRKVEAARIQPV